MPKELTRFFQSYRNGFDVFDEEAIASHSLLPASIYDGDGYGIYSSHRELSAKFEPNCQAFKAMGYEGAQFSVGSYRKAGDFGAVVDLGWRVNIAKGHRDFRTTYFCTLKEQQWYIFSAVAYEGQYRETDT